ncbi:Uncharacterised protein [Chlamydia trachomatis]|nr:Uncharacterised protein [Chlamydia trachomatis]
MEPAIHVQVGRVIERPLHTLSSTYVDRNEIDRQNSRQHKETEDASHLCATRDLIRSDEGSEN